MKKQIKNWKKQNQNYNMKYNIGDKVWVMISNKPAQVTITKKVIEYIVRDTHERDFFGRTDKDIFLTRQALIKSL